MEVLRIEGLCYSYDDGHPALEDITFSVQQGEQIVVLGPNGAGKSTLLHLLAGLRPLVSGKVFIKGKRMTQKNADDLRRSVGILFQDPDDQIFMPTVYDDVAFGPLNLGLDEKEVRQRVTRALKALGLERHKKRVPHKLSYGEKKKVAIAGVIAMDPEILLLDEPTANLDQRTRREFIDMINSMGKTTIITTHDVDFAAEVSSRTLVINKKLVADGDMRDIFMDEGLLKDLNLDLPNVAKLFKVLKRFGYKVEKLPLSMDHAVEELTRTMDEAGGHTHLHLHHHEHADGQDHHEHDGPRAPIVDLSSAISE